MKTLAALPLWSLVATVFAVGTPSTLNDKMPLTQMTLAKPMAGVGTLHHAITTASASAQQFYNQGLSLQHSYWYYEAARSFETATIYDPRCAMAFWGLSRALDSLGRTAESKRALETANELTRSASQREKLFIQARTLQQAGATNAPQARKLLAEVIALYPADEEAWMLRARMETDGTATQIADYHAVLRINSNHHGAHHELIHAYESFGRPALGWSHGEAYKRSAPSVAHAWHMQVHLASRLSRWDVAAQNTAKVIELEKAWQAELGTTMTTYWNSGHHFDIAMRSLIHDGKYQEARSTAQHAIDNKAQAAVLFNKGRLHQSERDWPALLKVAEEFRKANNKNDAAYFTCIAQLGLGQLEQAETECLALEAAYKNASHYRVLECRGLLLCETGKVGEGLKKLKEAAEKSQNDYGQHAYGGGAYFMVQWGQSALRCRRFDQAEEGYLEALAHDTMCAPAALGLQALMEAQGRRDEANRYAALAKDYWRLADAAVLDRELKLVRALVRGAALDKGEK